MSMKSLKKAIGKANKDTFETGTVIRWVAAGRYNYAALKAGDGRWYTTAQSYNTYVSGSYDFDGLLTVLTKSEVSEVAVSTDWAEINGNE